MDHFSLSLIFLSESQCCTADVHLHLNHLYQYKFPLNSEDVYNPDLPLESLRAKGGTMALWEASLDPYVSTLPTTSPAVLHLLLCILSFSPSIQVGLYLPMAGQDQ